MDIVIDVYRQARVLLEILWWCGGEFIWKTECIRIDINAFCRNIKMSISYRELRLFINSLFINNLSLILDIVPEKGCAAKHVEHFKIKTIYIFLHLETWPLILISDTVGHTGSVCSAEYFRTQKAELIFSLIFSSPTVILPCFSTGGWKALRMISRRQMCITTLWLEKGISTGASCSLSIIFRPRSRWWFPKERTSFLWKRQNAKSQQNWCSKCGTSRGFPLMTSWVSPDLSREAT